MKFKKFVAIALTAAMTLSMTASVFADVDPEMIGGATGKSSVEGVVDKRVVEVLLPVVPEDPDDSPYNYGIDPQRVVKDTADQRWAEDPESNPYTNDAMKAGVFFGTPKLNVENAELLKDVYLRDPDFEFPAYTAFCIDLGENEHSQHNYKAVDLTVEEVNEETNKAALMGESAWYYEGEPYPLYAIMPDAQYAYDNTSMVLTAYNIGNQDLIFGVGLAAIGGEGVELVGTAPEYTEDEQADTQLYLSLGVSENRIGEGPGYVSENALTDANPMVECDVEVLGSPDNFEVVYYGDGVYDYVEKEDARDWDYAQFEITGVLNHSTGINPETGKEVKAPSLAVVWEFDDPVKPAPKLEKIDGEDVPETFEGVFKSDDYAETGVGLEFNRNVAGVKYSKDGGETWLAYPTPSKYYSIDPLENNKLTVTKSVFADCNSATNPSERLWRVYFSETEYLVYTFTPYSM